MVEFMTPKVVYLLEWLFSQGVERLSREVVMCTWYCRSNENFL